MPPHSRKSPLSAYRTLGARRTKVVRVACWMCAVGDGPAASCGGLLPADFIIRLDEFAVHVAAMRRRSKLVEHLTLVNRPVS